MINGKKAILMIGAISAMNEIVIDAKKMGYYVVVTDWLPDSPAKKYADESWLLSIDEVDKIVEKCRERGVDGVMNYCIDPAQKYYYQICEKLGFPCVAGAQQFDIMTNKDKFARCCAEHGLDIIPKYNMDRELTEEDYAKLEYPIMVKPADGRASKGIIVANSAEEMPAAVAYAMDYSTRKEVVIEKYLRCPEFCVKYVACDGEFYFTTMSDVWDSVLPDGTRVYMGTSTYPSKFCQEYIRTTNDRVIAMLKDIGIRNGAMSLTGFYDNGKFRFFDPSLRMGGAQDWRVAEAASGVNIANLLTNFAMTGSMGDPAEISKIDKAFTKKCSALLYYDLKKGTVGTFEGVEDILKLPGVYGYHQLHNVGDTIDSYGTAVNVAIRFILSCDSREQFVSTVEQAHKLIKILDTDGNDMIAPKYPPEKYLQ